MAGLFGGMAAMSPLVDTSGPEPTLTRMGRFMAAASALKGDYGAAMQLKMMPQMLARQQQFAKGLIDLTQPTYADGPAPNLTVGPSAAAPSADFGSGAQADPASLATMPQASGGDWQWTPPVRTTNGATISDPRVAQAAAMAPMMGFDIDPFLKVLEASKPVMKRGDNGVFYNENDPSLNGAVAPKVGEGQFTRYGPGWQFQGVATAPGYNEAAAGTAGAVTGAQEAAKAPWNLVDVQLSNGAIAKLPLAIAAPMLASRYAAGGSGPQGGTTPGDTSNDVQFGVSQTPAAAELAKNRAATQGKNEADIAGARAAMQQVDDQTNMIAQNLHDMLGETQDPNTGKWVKTKPSMIGPLSAGSQTDIVEHIPFLNQRAKDLAAKIETVRNGTSFNSLQAIKNALAAAGDGGSASVRMTDQTARMLGEINGSLNQDQSGPQFEATVRRHLAQLDALNKARHDLFESQYRGIRPNTPGQTGPTANYTKPQRAAQMPQVGEVRRGYRYVGGDPSKPASWAPVQ